MLSQNIKNLITAYSKYGVIGNTLRLEASNVCQLDCPLCSTLRREKAPDTKFLNPENFKSLIKENPCFKNYELSLSGEIFINPDLLEIIKIADQENVNLTARNGANLNYINPEVLESLIKYKFKEIFISIDGATNQTYQKYRRGGDLEKVFEHIKKINEFKIRYNSEYPHLTWQYIVFSHNIDEVSVAKAKAKDLNMKFVLKFNEWDPNYAPVQDEEFLRRETGFTSIQEYEKKTKFAYMLHCYQMWYSPQITCDGTLTGCCRNDVFSNWGNYGNVFKDGLLKCLRGEKFIYTKRVLLRKEKPDKNIPCYHCPFYQKILQYKIDPRLAVLNVLSWFNR